MKPHTACRYLENKSFFLPPPVDAEQERSEPLATPSWCLLTHDAAGPDGKAVCETDCIPGRRCFQAEVEL